MNSQADKAESFLALHRRSSPLLMPNPWDLGSAKLLQFLGFAALATTSGGFAASLGRTDGSVSRDEAIAHAGALVGALDVPVSADLENCFADDPAGVAFTVQMALDAGLAGCSLEDYSTRADDPIYELALARDRVAAAAEVAHRGPVHLVLTARSEGFLRGRADLDQTITRLQAYQEAGADVLFAPGLREREDIATVCSNLDAPVNVLAWQGSPSVSELADAGVARISVGSAFAWVALAGLLDAANELLGSGTFRLLGASGGGEGGGGGRVLGELTYSMRGSLTKGG
jgi:2-methylisocitrate lyase-like PEP mutase family enzyme